jgi:hypothetical protein
VGDFLFVVQLAVGFVFLYASITKLKRSGNFGASLVDYEVLPSDWGRVIGPIILAAELAISYTFLTGNGIRLGGPAAMVLALGFVGTSTLVMLRGRTVPCLCFGASAQEMVGPRTLFRAVLLLVGSGLVTFGAFDANGSTTVRPAINVFVSSSVIALLLLNLISWIVRAGDLVALSKECQGCRRSVWFNGPSHSGG